MTVEKRFSLQRSLSERTGFTLTTTYTTVVMKPIIYQVLPRLFGNDRTSSGNQQPYGTIEQNGVGKFSNFTSTVLNNLRLAGYTHIWYTGVIDHATQTDYSAIDRPANHPAIVKGKAGSPYAIRDYYNVAPDLADNTGQRFEEFVDLIRRTHEAGLKVIMDFVPNHVARNYHSVSAPQGVRDLGADDRTDWHFAVSNNFYYCVGESFSPEFDRMGYVEYPARVTGNDCFTAHPSRNDWYETVKLNYGVDYCGGKVRHFDPIPDTWHKMIAILEFWVSHDVDGFRCDMAEMVPVEFWHWAISRIRALNPNVIFIAEVYNPQLYRSYMDHGGFDYLYDKVGLYDTLVSIVRHGGPASSVTYAWQAVDGIRHRMLSFIENHDEIRIASDITGQQDVNGLVRRGFAAAAISALMSTGAMMIYAGQEVGEHAGDAEGFSGRDGRTTIFDYWRVDKLCRLQQTLDGNNQLNEFEAAIYDKYSRLLNIARQPVVADGQFYDLMWLNMRNPQLNPDDIYTFVRYTGNEVLLVAANFAQQTSETGIVVAGHLFETMGLAPAQSVAAVELMTNNRLTISFEPAQRTVVSIPANDVVCLSFTLQAH